jgi:hypothetical protein
MSKRIDHAIAEYHAATSPDAIEGFLEIARESPYSDLVTTQGMRIGALSELRDAIDAEISLLDAEIDGRSLTESAVRKRASRAGYSVSKSRDRDTPCNNVGQLMLCNASNHVVVGDRFDASLHDIAEYLQESAT